jgi:hypothetical protein
MAAARCPPDGPSGRQVEAKLRFDFFSAAGPSGPQ